MISNSTVLTSLILIPFLIVIFFDLSLLVRYLLLGGRGKSENLIRDRAVSVIVPTYNAEKTISGTIRSIIGSDLPKHEIIIVDDGSTDATLEKCREMDKGNLIILHKRHRGKWAALNSGVKAAKHENVIVVDADTFVGKEAILELVTSLSSHDAVAANLLVSNTSSFLGHLQAQEHVRVSIHRRAEGNVDTISGPLAGFTREVLIKHPYRDSIVEDFEHTLRLRGNGASIAYNPNAKAYTFMPESIKDYISQRRRWSGGTLKEMRDNDISFKGLIKGYIVAVADILSLPLLLGFGLYQFLLALFAFEAVVQIYGNYREGAKMYSGAVFFYPQLIILAIVFLGANLYSLLKD